MIQRLLRTSVLGMLTFALLLGGGPVRADFVHADPSASTVDLLESRSSQASQQYELRSTIAFSSTRDYPSTLNAEIYLMPMKDDGTQDLTQPPRRLTNTPGDGEAFATLSPDGKKIVFDSNRARAAGEPGNTSDLFVMDSDSSELHAPAAHLVRGSSASWSPDSKNLAYHASASGTGALTVPNRPGAATTDSDIFIMNVDDVLTRAARPKNLTNRTPSYPGYTPVNDDADWSPDGKRILFVSHNLSDPRPANPNSSEIYIINADGTNLQRLTQNLEEERAPDWSPDGRRFLYLCRKSDPPGEIVPFQLCIKELNADGITWGAEKKLTDNGLPHLTASWSPDGKRIVFHRQLPPQNQMQLFVLRLNEDGNCQPACAEKQLTSSNSAAGTDFNAFPNWGVLRIPGGAPAVTQPSVRAPAAAPVPQPRGR